MKVHNESFDPHSDTKPLVDALSWSLPIWAITRLVLSAWGGFLWYLDLVPDQSIGYDFYFGSKPILEGWRGALLGVWQRWDAIHYLRIAQSGYESTNLSAFFPAYPLLGRYLSMCLGHDTLLALILISNIALLGACVLLFEIVKAQFSSDVARIAVTSLLLFPTTFFLFAPYPQSLSLFLVLLAYWSACNSKWWLTFLAGVASGLTHSTVLPLMLALGWIVWTHYRHGSGRTKRYLFLVPLGPALGMGIFFAWRTLNGFPPYTELLLAAWGRGAHPPWQILEEFLQLIRSDSWWLTGWLNVSLLLLAALGLGWGIRRLPISMLIFHGSLLLFLISTTTQLDGWGRYALIMFPLFILLGLWFSSYKRRLVGFVIAIGLQLYFAGLFIMWIWTG
jgi:hypothetical protein